MPPIKRPKVGAKTATGSEAKNIIARRRNSAAKTAVGSPASKSPRKNARKGSEDDGVKDEPYEPSEDEIDGGIAEGSSPVSKPAKGKRAGETPTKKLIYKKHLRRDASKFTTSQAMVDAEEEFDPRAAALRGKATQSGGNGRKKGRRLIRWTAQADQLLLLCLHHEMARNKEELPYEAIAQRMFPEKNATGGAIKERFAKLRIECLNRGSWVPPILGKTPQNTRPDVRGVVRLAPGIDKGRFILWKEDASKLIDPKDINKGHVDAQKKGLEFPERIWISPSAEKEYFKTVNDHKAWNHSPIAGPVPTDDDELLSDEDEEDDMEVVSDDGVAVPCTPKKRKAAVSTGSSNKKPRAVARPTPKKIAAKGKAKQADDSEFEGTTPCSGNRRLSPRKVSGGPKRYVATTPIESSDSSTAKTDESSDESDDDESPTNNRLMMMAFDKDEEVRPLRSIVIVRGFTPGALSKYPAGIQGPGDDDYADDEVAEKVVAQYDGGDGGQPVTAADGEDKAAVLYQSNPDAQIANGMGRIGQKSSMYKKYYNVQDLLSAMSRNTDSDGEVINKRLWENHLEQMNALNAGGIVESPPQSPTHNQSDHQTEDSQYGQGQAQNQFTANGLSSLSDDFEGSQIGFGDSQVDFGDFNFLPVRSREMQGMVLQRNTKNFNENGSINATQHQMTKEKVVNQSFIAKQEPAPEGLSGQDVTLAPAPGDDYFSFDEYTGTGQASFDGSFGPLDPTEGYLNF
ncbi:hypothetical protein V492_04725 [Pseudogymnoascus sp. VKM F-4246]|nr:hypothetical protein V492_04725 [Pseudogymnoascus sp. VKM F-4246]